MNDLLVYYTAALMALGVLTVLQAVMLFRHRRAILRVYAMLVSLAAAFQRSETRARAYLQQEEEERADADEAKQSHSG
jgi:hypothetical protein